MRLLRPFFALFILKMFCPHPKKTRRLGSLPSPRGRGPDGRYDDEQGAWDVLVLHSDATYLFSLVVPAPDEAGEFRHAAIPVVCLWIESDLARP